MVAKRKISPRSQSLNGQYLFFFVSSALLIFGANSNVANDAHQNGGRVGIKKNIDVGLCRDQSENPPPGVACGKHERGAAFLVLGFGVAGAEQKASAFKGAFVINRVLRVAGGDRRGCVARRRLRSAAGSERHQGVGALRVARHGIRSGCQKEGHAFGRRFRGRDGQKRRVAPAHNDAASQIAVARDFFKRFGVVIANGRQGNQLPVLRGGRVLLRRGKKQRQIRQKRGRGGGDARDEASRIAQGQRKGQRGFLARHSVISIRQWQNRERLPKIPLPNGSHQRAVAIGIHGLRICAFVQKALKAARGIGLDSPIQQVARRLGCVANGCGLGSEIGDQNGRRGEHGGKGKRRKRKIGFDKKENVSREIIEKRFEKKPSYEAMFIVALLAALGNCFRVPTSETNRMGASEFSR